MLGGSLLESLNTFIFELAVYKSDGTMERAPGTSLLPHLPGGESQPPHSPTPPATAAASHASWGPGCQGAGAQRVHPTHRTVGWGPCASALPHDSSRREGVRHSIANKNILTHQERQRWRDREKETNERKKKVFFCFLNKEPCISILTWSLLRYVAGLLAASGAGVGALQRAHPATHATAIFYPLTRTWRPCDGQGSGWSHGVWKTDVTAP